MAGVRLLTAGESHGPALTGILDGIPAGLPLDEAMLRRDLARRQKGAGAGARMEMERDAAKILSGVMAGSTTGAPIGLLIENRDHANWKGKAVEPMTTPRPGHADLAAALKYGHDDFRKSLERASARETAMRVAAGGVCRQLLAEFGIRVGGYVASIGSITAPLDALSFEERLARSQGTLTGCPDPVTATAMEEAIAAVQKVGETLGGVIEVVALGVPPGLGSYAQADRRLDSRLAAAVLGVQAMKGVEIGSAFENTRMAGTQVHDPIRKEGDRLVRPANRCGGIEGGMSNGEPVWLRAAMKPIPTTLKPQPSVDALTGEQAPMKYERSDVCPVPRAVVVLESVVALVLANALLEKLGGDSIAEMKPRFEKLRAARLSDLTMNGLPQVFWP
jgi:chorismate synthase